MNSEGNRVLLLVGSPKAPGKSVSEALGAYVIEKMEARRWSSETIFIRMSLQSDEGRAALVEAVKTADLIILSFPLYVDSLPAPVIRAMELIAEARFDKGTHFVAIANCGFPEAQHNKVAMSICQRFAHASGLEWAGGLALGMGGALSGQRLEEQGGMVRNIIKALDLAVDAFAENKPVPDEAIRLMAKPIIPGWMYTTMGNIGWRRQANCYGVRKKIRDRPYQR
ncbi:MAG TPA: hypothetical protein ENH11_05905 [Candidatus Acetothermia bacterium]|nr:hypothetical protein [Candidatus Acetothermia bacterium]